MFVIFVGVILVSTVAELLFLRYVTHFPTNSSTVGSWSPVMDFSMSMRDFG